MNVLLTGGSGFVGRHVLSALLAKGHQVVTLGRGQSTAASPDWKHIQLDLGDVSESSLDWGTVDAVVHLAAAGVKASGRSWADTLQTNVVSSYRLLSTIAISASRRPPVFVAGTFYEQFVRNRTGFLDNPYAATKAAFADIASIWAEQYPGPVILGSLFQVYGPGDDAANVLTYAANCFAKGHSAAFGSGHGLRDWVYVTDVAEAVLCSLTQRHSGCIRWDIGTGNLTSIRAMILQLAELAGVSADTLVFDPTRDRVEPGESISALRLPPTWVPRVANRSGLAHLLAAARTEAERIHPTQLH